ncbi:MAG: HAD family hydrolase [Acidimicrobiales bacterium]
MGAPLVIGFDGDDTLWHSERYFVLTQERIMAELAPWVAAERFEEALLATERANLARFGYGVKGFLLSTIETAISLTEARVPASLIHQIVQWGKELLDHPVELLPDVAPILEDLSAQHRLVLITKGDLFHQEAKVAGSGLADRFDAVHIVAEKHVRDYERVLASVGVAPSDFVMVGNSLRSDIVPAAELGGRAVHVPYHVTWALEEAEVPEVLADRVTRIDRMGELPAVLDQLRGAGQP